MCVNISQVHLYTPTGRHAYRSLDGIKVRMVRARKCVASVSFASEAGSETGLPPTAHHKSFSLLIPRLYSALVHCHSATSKRCRADFRCIFNLISDFSSHKFVELLVLHTELSNHASQVKKLRLWWFTKISTKETFPHLPFLSL